MAHRRLFAALEPPPAIRTRLLAAMGGVADARWQTDGQLHATLLFIGEVNRHVADEVAIRLAALRAPAVSVSLGGFGTFDSGPGRRITALWIGLEPVAALTALHRRVLACLAPAGISPEPRRFLPHVTLARFPARGVPPAALERFLSRSLAPRGGWQAREVVLYESHLTRGGAHYEPLLRVPLEPPAGAAEGEAARGSSAGPRPPAA